MSRKTSDRPPSERAPKEVVREAPKRVEKIGDSAPAPRDEHGYTGPTSEEAPPETPPKKG